MTTVLIFGASGMIGQGVLDACLRDASVDRIIVIGRTRIRRSDTRIHEVVTADVTDLAPHTALLSTVSACFFCLGTSAAGKSEAAYTRVTYDIAMAIAPQLARFAPSMTFIYVSGLGTDSTERTGAMWARVKGRTENALLALPFRASYMFRPGLVMPEGNARSKTTVYRVAYLILTPLLPLLKRFFPAYITTTGEIGRAMLNVARRGYAKRVLESRDITAASTVPRK